jgi:hypothetical protein
LIVGMTCSFGKSRDRARSSSPSKCDAEKKRDKPEFDGAMKVQQNCLGIAWTRKWCKRRIGQQIYCKGEM